MLDLFAVAGALRSRNEQEIAQKFALAFQENPEMALRLLFYVGDTRGGLGERRTFRIGLKWLAKNHPEVVRANLSLIPHYNRWDSLFILIGTPCETDMWNLIEKTFWSDWEEYKKGHVLT